MGLERLVGRKVIALYLNDDATLLRFACPGRDLIFQAIGDCCSHSWFNDIIGVCNLIGATVTKVCQKPEQYGERQANDWHDGELKIYAYTLHTDKGFVDIIFRNESNGYYGGWLEDANDAIIQDKWIQITEDVSK